ncbi:MAG: ABC transporter substrate binding protein [Gallionellaceae bacterium]
MALAIALPVRAAAEAPIAVIYPDIGGPYREVFDKIIDGIEEKVETPVAKYPVTANTDLGRLKTNLLRDNTKAVIALGWQGMATAMTLNNGIRVVVGGVLTVPDKDANQQTVISLSPDPALLFTRMKALMPSVRRVFVTYDPSFNAWLINLAKEAARTQGLELVAYEAKDLRSAVRYYQDIFSHADGHSDVLWLPQDPTTVEESSILPLVLQESWNKGIAVFSSNSSHVRRGVLFSLYPDNEALGSTLADLARGILSSGTYSTRGMIPLRDVQGVVNLRTANHLGIKPARLQDFAVTLPEK